MMAVTARPQLKRSDRYVRQAVLQLGVGVSQTRTIFSVEEALRLTALPGENEGRVYFIRRLSIQGLPADCARQVWLDRFQKAIAEAGAEAVHASHPDADSAAGVYFVSDEEACEMLLARLVANQPVRGWFWPLVLGDHRVSDRSGQILGVIERLCRTPAGWAAVAETVCSALAERDPIPLLEALPGVAVRAWLCELGGPPSGAAFERPVTLPSWLKSLLTRATARYGSEDSRTVWLAALSVIHANPEAATGRAVARAAATLRWVQRSGHAPNEGAADSDAAPNAAAPASLPCSLASVAVSDREHARSDETAADSSSTAARSRSRRVRIVENEFTEAGGLYFLLNAMRRLGIENAYAAVPELAESAFLPRLFDTLAGHAGVTRGDPARRWIDSAREAAASIDFPLSAALWPSTLRPVRPPQCDVDFLVRAWTVSVRRWCWRAGRVRLLEVVRRPARISLTRTHLDVTLALDQADLRIRRIGLDLDPGWLPWFGRVIQFHYTDSDPGADS